MYLDFFRLKTRPFELVPNPEFLFPGASHRQAMSHLEYGLKSRAGFILLTGEVGSGKTTILRDFVRRLGDRAPLAMVFNTRVTPLELLAMVAEEYGLEVSGKGKVELLRELNDFLIAENAKGRRPVLVVDEAQNLAPEVLEEIRLLSNLEADTFKLLQIILVGQPELKERIARPELRQLKQRLSVRCHLEPLGTQETRDYILHRLEKAGNRKAVSFGEGTFEVIYRYSGGTPRLINIFCDFLLLSAFVEGRRELTLDLVEEVVGEIAGETMVEIEPEGADGGKDEESPVADLERRLDLHERMVKKLLRKQRSDIDRLQKSLDTICGLLESLPERMRATNVDGTECKPEKVIRLK